MQNIFLSHHFDNNIEQGVPIMEYRKRSTDKADVVITINPGQENHWQRAEIEIAAGFQKDIIPLGAMINTEKMLRFFHLSCILKKIMART